MNARETCLRLCALAGLSVSVALAADQFLPVPAFCGFQAGCEAVTRSVYGRFLGVPLSVIGVVAFAGFFLLTLAAGRRLPRSVGSAAFAAGLAGCVLVASQVFILRRTCPLCLIVDASAILLAAIELGWPASTVASAVEATPPSWNRSRFVWLAAGGVAFAAPLLWTQIRPAPAMPPEIRSVQDPQAVTLVEITDFACPHCRQSHPALRAFLARHPEVRFVRFVAPLKTHADSRPAARSYLCAERQGRGAAFADALFAAEDLSPATIRQLAVDRGLDPASFEADIADPELDRELDATLDWVARAEAQGLPQFWLNDLPLLGEQTLDGLTAALARLESRRERGTSR